MPRFDSPRLLADIGGTYARFTLEIGPGEFTQMASLRCADHADFHAAVRAYLGASSTLSSKDLRLVAAQLAANEATHFSFFNAAAGGHGVLPSLPKPDTIPNTVKKLQPFLA